jgi:rhodanese-related sulfurtransferase
MSAVRSLIAVCAVLGTLLAPVASAETVDIGPEELKSLLDKGVPIVDLRTAGEWRQTGVVKGSQLITLFDEQGRADPGDWQRKLDKLVPADKPVILICRSGNRTGQAAQMLQRAGRKGVVYNVRGGIAGWAREGRAVVALEENIRQAGITCSPSC